MKEEIGQDKQELAATNNGTEQKSHDSVSEEPGIFPGFEFLKELPPESRKVAEIAMFMHRFGPEPDPLADKLTEGHIERYWIFLKEKMSIPMKTSDNQESLR